MSSKLALFHILALCESIFALFVYHYYVEKFRQPTYGGHWKFLTYINLNIQLACFSMCVFCDLLQWLQYHSFVRTLRQFKDYFYASIGVPSCLAVFVSFWALFFIDRELVYPKQLDEYMPLWANHVWHSVILITLIEVVCDHHHYPRRSFGMSACSVFGIGYIVWVEWVHKHGNITVYPILKQLEGAWYYLFIGVELLFSWLTYLLGEFLNAKVGVTQSEEQTKAKELGKYGAAKRKKSKKIN